MTGESPNYADEVRTTGLIEEALQEIYIYREGLEAVLAKYGTMPLTEYSRRVLGEGGVDHPESGEASRVIGLANAIAEEANVISPLYGDTRDDITRAVSAGRVINTGPHHGIFSHAYFTGDLVLATLGKLGNPNDAIVVVADASVPLQNLSFGAGFILTETVADQDTGKPVPIKYHLSPSHRQTATTVAAPITRKEVADARNWVTNDRDAGNISPYKASIVWRTLGELGKDTNAMAAESLSSQATYINALLYPRLFAPDVRDQLPKLVYVDSERVMTRALLDLLGSDNPLFTAIVFDPEIRRQFVAMTREIGVTKSTDLFLTTMDSGERSPMTLDDTNEVLTYPNRANRKREVAYETFSLDQETITEQLRAGRVYPGAGLIFAMLGYYGVDAIGGFNQSIGYLPKFYEAYAEQLASWGLADEAERVSHLDSHRISTTLSTVFVRRGGVLQGAGLFDVMAKRGTTPDGKVASQGLSADELASLQNLTVSELVKVNIPGIYNMVVPQEQQRPELGSLTTDAIAKALKIDHKLIVIDESE